MRLRRARVTAVAIVAIAGCSGVAGCASFVERQSIVTGTVETLSIDTDPAGAACRVDRGKETLGSVTSPARIDVITDRNDLVIVCKKAAFEVATAVLHATPDQPPDYVGVLAGWAIDWVERPHYRYAPEVKVALIASREPIGSDYSQAIPALGPPASDSQSPPAGMANPDRGGATSTR